jgi:hypothetical protein
LIGPQSLVLKRSQFRFLVMPLTSYEISLNFSFFIKKKGIIITTYSVESGGRINNTHKVLNKVLCIFSELSNHWILCLLFSMKLFKC